MICMLKHLEGSILSAKYSDKNAAKYKIDG